MSGRYRHRYARFALGLGASLVVSGVTLVLAPAAVGDVGPGCGHACAGGGATRVLAEAGKSSDAYRAAREERRTRREAERRTRGTVRSLERQLKRASKAERSTSRRRRSGSGDGQAGRHCVYGIDGKLIHAGKGTGCAATNGGAGDVDRVSGSFATGCVKGNCQQGQGAFIWNDGSRYVGQFKNGRQHGQGSLVFSSGASYVGQWRDGKRSGTGTAMLPDGRVQAGMWEDNAFVGTSQPAPRSIAAGEVARWPDLSEPAHEVNDGKHDAAVVVGIENYAHVAAIPGAQQNGGDWYKYLVKTRGVPIERVTLLLDADATAEEIHYAAEHAAGLVGKKGTLWFVFIGHGAPTPDAKDGLLVGFDAQQKARSLKARSFKRSELIAILESSRAKRINVLLDACFSGRTSGGEQLIAGLQPLVVTSDAPTSDPRMVLMTAARSDQFAGPLPGATRPAFSYLVLGGLRGWADRDGNGRVLADELDDYVSSAMSALIRSRRQNPTFVGDDGTTLSRSARETGPDISEMVLSVSSPASSAGR